MTGGPGIASPPSSGGQARRLLSVDVPVAVRGAHVLVTDPNTDRDALIAATAHVHGFIVVTRNGHDVRSRALRC